MAKKSTVKILYLGDIMGSPGRQLLSQHLPALRQNLKADLVIAQAENVSHGKGMTPAHMRELQACGVDFFTGGNHTLARDPIKKLLADPLEPVVAPINLPGANPDWGAKVLPTSFGDVLVISLLGTTFPQLDTTIINPLKAVDAVLAAVKNQKFAAKIVNFHGDFSSEKRVIGFYLDGRVSMVVGDHWHVPTADAMVLPGGTAHITDVGMCGTMLSSLGVEKEVIIARWLGESNVRHAIATQPPYQICGLLAEIDPSTGLAIKVQQIHQVLEELG